MSRFPNPYTRTQSLLQQFERVVARLESGEWTYAERWRLWQLEQTLRRLTDEVQRRDLQAALEQDDATPGDTRAA